MRIAFISTILHFPWGGADSLWTQAAESAMARGDQLFLSLSPLTAKHHRIETLCRYGAHIYLRQPPPSSIPLARRIVRKLGMETSADQKLIAALEKFGPDLVIFSLGGTYDLLMHQELSSWLITKSVPFRVVANGQTEHPSLSQEDISRIRTTLESADLIGCVSTRNLQVTRRHLLASLPRARVIQNPLRWRPDEYPDWPSDSVVKLATVSRLDEGKGIHLLLHALKEIERDVKLPPWCLEIVGDGPYAPTLRSIVQYLGLDSHVTFRGHVDGKVSELWTYNHLLCSPSLNEGVPMTIPEAMLCGRPVLATCVGGAEDWIQHRTTGYLCPAPTIPLIASALREAIDDKARWPHIGAEARRSAITRYRDNDHLLLIS
jgi:glycosyltransferase involved in cell wall biosynthesis